MSGNLRAVEIIEDYFLHASIISQIETLGFHMPDAETSSLLSFFDNEISVQSISDDIKNKAIYIKREYKLKTADSIIAATAWSLNIPLISADKDFSKVKEITFLQFEV